MKHQTSRPGRTAARSATLALLVLAAFGGCDDPNLFRLDDTEEEGVPPRGPSFLTFETNPDSTISLGDSVQVEVELEDPSGIQSVSFVGLAYRGDAAMGTDVVVERFAAKTITFPRPTEGEELPKHYILTPYLHASDDLEAEPVEIVVTATDGLGNVSDTVKVMFVGGPNVNITYPPDEFGVGPGADFDVRISVHDGAGIDSARLILSGHAEQSIDLPLPARTDTPFVIVQNVTMPSTQGTVSLQARAWNTSRIAGQSRPLSVEVSSAAATDDQPPVVSVAAERVGPADSGNRMEMSDSIRIRVSAFDANSGLGRIGITAIVLRGSGEGQTLRVEEERTFSGSRSREELVFVLSMDSLYDRLGVPPDPATRDSILPENLDLWIHGFAADRAGNVACSIGIDEQRDCSPDGYSASGYYAAADSDGLNVQITGVRGFTVLLDNRSAVIGDIAIDTVDERVFLSNKSQNLIEVLQLDSDVSSNRFRNSIQVGSEPLGLFMGDRVVSETESSFGLSVTPGSIARTLLVANSGGTNISMVHMDPSISNVQEVDVVRLRTPNARLFEIDESEGENGAIKLSGTYLDFADRPHFLAQDSLLRIIYSTVSTDAATTTNLRVIYSDPVPTTATDEPEVRFLLTNDMVDSDSENTVSLANVDSLFIYSSTLDSDRIEVFAHEPGYPDQVISSGLQRGVAEAVQSIDEQMRAAMEARGVGDEVEKFLPFWRRGSWNIGELGWSDTTFVTASGDRGTIAIGEGATAPTGRIMLWHGSRQPQLSSEEIADLVNNASEEVLGVGLNQNGTLGVARGRDQTYFFTPDLRLQGVFDNSSSGGAGAAFHPEHNSVIDGSHADTDGHGAAFTATSENSIDVVNTYHFNRVNSLLIRDNIVGPLRSGPPLDSDNNGQGGQCVALAATEAARKDCIVVKLYGVTSAGGVVVVNVRRRDLEPYASP